MLESLAIEAQAFPYKVFLLCGVVGIIILAEMVFCLSTPQHEA
jgi:hypothetical protein